MVSIILVSHGFFSKELLGSAQLIIGEQADVQTAGFHLGESIESLKEKIISALENVQNKKEILVLSDMVAGSPFNVTASLTRTFAFEHVTGINLPILLEILSQRRNSTAKELADMAVRLAPDVVIDGNKFIQEG